MKKDSKKTFQMIGFHSRVMFKGLMKMAYGALMAVLLTIGICGFIMVPSEEGYAAVSDFLVSSCTVVVALGGIYLMGGNPKKGAKK
jgi:O-antigen/teichoic acid export membrane protein